MKRSILIVDDDPRILTALSGALGQGADVRTAGSAEEALSALGRSGADVVLADVRMPGMDGVELLRLLRQRVPDVDVLLMTAYEDLPTVATAMREGARDFLIKPLDLHDLRRLLDRVFEDRAIREQAGRSRTANPPADQDDRLIGRDRKLVEIFKLVGQVAPTRTTVLIRGDSGTGKELIAREIHSRSQSAGEPFVAVNCAALPETLLESELFGHVRGSFTGATTDRTGRFAQAGKGTIFLDEIGDTTPAFQSKLLRVLQQHEFHPVGSDTPRRTEARVIAATHRDLEQMLAAGEFREDLYYRLRVVEIMVPPLRDRPGDIPLLARHFVARASRAMGGSEAVLSPEAIEVLSQHAWPGNVRELENCIARAVVQAAGDVIRVEHLDLGGSVGVGPLATLEEAERTHLIRVLEATGGQKLRAAEILGISRPRLDRLIRKYSLRARMRSRADSTESGDDSPGGS